MSTANINQVIENYNGRTESRHAFVNGQRLFVEKALTREILSHGPCSVSNEVVDFQERSVRAIENAE
jgi:hypothetical protein